MSNLHRKHPVSIAVSMALLSAMAATATAAPGTGAPADTPEAQAVSPQDTATTPSPKSKPKPGEVASGGEQTVLSTVTVVGVRASQMRAIDLKRFAPDIQDSISAESIGQLPDTTITDALQRITGVQIDRNGGEGTEVDVRGLPQVGSMLNGEVFITPDQITSQEPDFETLPATLFNQVDVIKSPVASQTDEGISGSLDLHTFRPWDLPHGFTFSYNADGERGDVARKLGPEASGLVSFNDDGRWGLLLSGDYSDTRRNGPESNNAAGGVGAPSAGSSEGLDQYGVILDGENAESAGGYAGFVGAWNGLPIPSKIVQNPDGSVDVNGDGKSNGVFMGSQNIGLYESNIERKRESGNASFQADLGDGFTLTSDYFYSQQRQYNRNVGLQFNSTDWQGATYVPLQSHDTGATALSQYNTPPPDPAWSGSQIYTTQVYEKWPGDVESYSQLQTTGSVAQNANLEVNFDNGGDFKGSLRGVRETASQAYMETDLNISDSDGCLWPNQLMPDVSSSEAPPCGTFIYPSQLGGNRVFNPIGIPEDSEPIIANFTGKYLTVSMPSSMAANFANPNGWTFKTIESSGDDYSADAGITALRFDGHYDLHHGLHLDFGVRNSIHTANNYAYTLVTPVYAGMGASDPNGCLVRYVGADVILAGGGAGSCSAGNSEGYFRAGPLSAVQMSNTPPALAGNWQEYTNLLNSGINFWAVNPSAMDNIWGFWKSLYPDTTTQEDPGDTWAVWMKETSAYVQTDFAEQVGDMPFTGNVGVRVIHTNLDITQHLDGLPGLYGTNAADIGTTDTQRGYYDVLPDLNLALDLTEKLTARFAASKNMQPLDLQTWGGGLSLNYSLAYITNPNGTKTQLYEVAQGQSNGNPKLDPWRSTNYGASLEYYINAVSMVDLELFRINVESFIENGNVQNCDLPDEDGVVRHRCISIIEPVQGGGNSIQGAEFDYRQGFTFLPGLLRYTGTEFNVTYAPSKSGQEDLAGHAIPFQDNSTESGNFILWYQDKRLQVRAAYNYRSKRAVENDVGSIMGLEMYEAPQAYIDASVQYAIDKYVTVYVNGSNLTNEYERYYLVWPSQEGHANYSERSYTVGLRGQW
ncbi:MAG: TonB-dependent receptor [Steroidobacteraceae bacterium]